MGEVRVSDFGSRVARRGEGEKFPLGLFWRFENCRPAIEKRQGTGAVQDAIALAMIPEFCAAFWRESTLGWMTLPRWGRAIGAARGWLLAAKQMVTVLLDK